MQVIVATSSAGGRSGAHVDEVMMGEQAANINEKRRKTVGFFAGPTWGIWKPYALWNREIRIRPGFRRSAEFEVPVCLPRSPSNQQNAM
ncbi:hypothetical protein [Sphingopyxis sp.]|uniref:hypothetical protein n=1 Tax=Sphingopyxis sp. TaxID=1908224 RepID=UPI001D537D35|nr:hypothetical protein [Sphingopyxis sp.]MBW8296169.1 hypothetical protein [Sphingopyxis sp.]